MRVRIRGQAAEMNDHVRSHADRMVHFTIGRFAQAVRDVSLSLEELGKPWSGTLFRCRVSVRLVPRGHVSARNEDGDASAAVDGALDRAERAVQRRLQFRLQGYAPSDQTNR
jgi:ribosome-associated translation inhibitor RaiA